MIEVNGRQYKTLKENLYANGKKVLAAYCNDKLVYPDRENATLLKFVGHINTIVGHNHAGEAPSASANSGENYTYYEGDSYRAKGCFCVVMRSYSNRPLFFSTGTTTLPDTKWPLTNGSISGISTGGDIYKGNQWLVFPYTWSTAALLPSGDGVHPLLGSDAMETHVVSRDSYTRQYISAEILLHLDVSAPHICSFSADKMYVGTGYPYMNALGVPKKSSLSEVPADVNGLHRMYVYRRDIYFGISWTLTSAAGRKFEVRLCQGARSGTSRLCTHLKVLSDTGYEIPYTIRGTQQGVYRTVETTYKQKFRILNIPITDSIYLGSELTAPEEHLHPRLEDIAEYM